MTRINQTWYVNGVPYPTIKAAVKAAFLLVKTNQEQQHAHGGAVHTPLGEPRTFTSSATRYSQ